jgi:peroxiredoxin
MTFKEYYDSLGKKNKTIFCLIAFVTFISFIFTTAAISFIGFKLITLKMEKLPLEMEIPKISLKDEKGIMIDLTEDPPSKKLLFFFKPECPACRMELSNLQYISKKYSEDELQILSISETDEDETKRFLKTYAVNFPTLMDPEKSLREILKFHGTPGFFLVDENNTIKYARVGYKKLPFDEMLIAEFLRSSKIPIEIFGSE